MPYEDATAYRFNPFDITKVWPHGDYPLTEAGRFTLDRNPADYHTEIEQLAVAPATCAGIGPSPDRLLLGGCSPTPTRTGQARRELTEIRSFAPVAPVHAYTKDGIGRVPTSPTRCTSPTPRAARRPTPHNPPPTWYSDGDMVRTAYELHAEDDDWGQAGTLVREVWTTPQGTGWSATSSARSSPA